MTRRTALIGLATLVPFPAGAQAPSSKQKTSGDEIAVLEQAATFDINPQSGALKETIQKGQVLI